MNHIYKLVYSKTKGMYVAVCEFARSHGKFARTKSKITITGLSVLLCLSMSSVVNAYSLYNDLSSYPSGTDAVDHLKLSANSVVVGEIKFASPFQLTTGFAAGKTIEKILVVKNLETGAYSYHGNYYGYNADGNLGELGFAIFSEAEVKAALGDSTIDLKSAISGNSYTAGNGISISSANVISAKAGTNVTVDTNGISVNGTGTVSSGNTGLINGGTLYAEVRPSDNGNYVRRKNSLY